MRLSFILLAITYLFEFVYTVESRCKSFVCGPLEGETCTQEYLGPDGNYNYTMQDCKDRSTEYCPWSSLVPDTNSTVSCTNNTAPVEQK